MVNTRFFNGSEYSATDWAAFFKVFYGNGFINRPDVDALKVTPGSGLNVNVKNGVMMINGYQAETVNTVLSVASTGAAARYDRVVFRLDMQTIPQNIVLIVKQGNTVAPPSLQRDENIYEMSVAQIFMPANNSLIANATITDERLHPLVCGVSSFLGANVFTTPTGTVTAYAAETEPPGWFACDGRVLNRNAYSELFSVIGVKFNKGDESDTTFRIPDMRGEFPRGWDNGRGVDAGRELGSFQPATAIAGQRSNDLQLINADGTDGTTQVGSAGWAYSDPYKPYIAVRTRNVALNFIIKW